MENKQNNIEELKEQKDTFTELEILANSKGGELLVDTLMSDVVGDIDTLCMQGEELSLQKFISISARMREKIAIIRVLKRAEKNKEFIVNELKEELATALQ